MPIHPSAMLNPFTASPHLAPALGRQSRRRSDIALNLTAMIDVTFLLLVYFMAATKFRTGEEVYRMDLPDRSRAVAPDPFALDERPLRIEVASRGGRTGADSIILRLDGPYPQPGSIAELHRFLVDRRIGPDALGGLFEPDHPIIISPAADTSWQHALLVYNAVARARYTNVTLGPPLGGS